MRNSYSMADIIQRLLRQSSTMLVGICLVAQLATPCHSQTQISPNVDSKKLSSFTENVLTHVVLHELGHALVREFDLPILGNEETLADAFATHYAARYLPNDAKKIIECRVRSLMLEANEETRSDWTVKGEHNSDARRAYQIAALAIAFDAQKFRSLAALVDMDDSDIRQAIDYGNEIHRSWRRTLKPLMMPPGELSTEARIRVDGESQFSERLSQSRLDVRLETVVKKFDWHSQVTIHFAGGAGGASWSRSKRTVTIRDDYIRRFQSQGQRLEEVADEMQTTSGSDSGPATAKAALDQATKSERPLTGGPVSPCDIRWPGVASDIISNALNRGIQVSDENAVQSFLAGSDERYKTGEEVFQAAVNKFQVSPEELKFFVLKYLTTNCKDGEECDDARFRTIVQGWQAEH